MLYVYPSLPKLGGCTSIFISQYLCRFPSLPISLFYLFYLVVVEISKVIMKLTSDIFGTCLGQVGHISKKMALCPASGVRKVGSTFDLPVHKRWKGRNEKMSKRQNVTNNSNNYLIYFLTTDFSFRFQYVDFIQIVHLYYKVV